MPFFTSFSGKILSAPGLKLGSRLFQFAKTLSSNVQEYNLRNDLLANGWDGVTPVDAQITVNSGVYVWSDNISTAAFTTGSLVADSVISIINNGYIIGKGGNASWVRDPMLYDGNFLFTPVQNGGPAINLNYPVSITNNSYIAGGGGGGRSGSMHADTNAISETNARVIGTFSGGGGGAGGGDGGYALQDSSQAIFSGWDQEVFRGLGGNVGQTGGSGGGITDMFYFSYSGWYNGGGGGRILPGVGGTGSRTWIVDGNGFVTGGYAQGGGAGGGAAFTHYYTAQINGVDGGSAGNAGVAGSRGGPTNGPGGGSGGGWGASGGSSANGAGGTGGKAVNLNGNTVTWVATGTRYGAIS